MKTLIPSANHFQHSHCEQGQDNFNRVHKPNYCYQRQRKNYLSLQRPYCKINRLQGLQPAGPKKMRSKNRQQSSFTLIEATIVLFIIGLLMLLILPNLSQQRNQAQQTHAQAMVATVQTQVDLYLNDHPQKEQVTVDDLVKENYLTQRQVEKIKSLKINIVGHEAKI